MKFCSVFSRVYTRRWTYSTLDQATLVQKDKKGKKLRRNNNKQDDFVRKKRGMEEGTNRIFVRSDRQRLFGSICELSEYCVFAVSCFSLFGTGKGHQAFPSRPVPFPPFFLCRGLKDRIVSFISQEVFRQQLLIIYFPVRVSISGQFSCSRSRTLNKEYAINADKSMVYVMNIVYLFTVEP